MDRVKYVEDFFGFDTDPENKTSPLMPEFYNTDKYADENGDYNVPIEVTIDAFLSFPYKEESC